MQVKKTSITDTKVKLTITADQDFLDKVKEHVLRHMAGKHVNLPGFRSGKAPLSLVEKSADPQLLQSEFLDEAVNRMYGQAVRAEKVRPVDQPQVNLKKFVPFTELEFDAEVEAVGEIKLANYKAIKLSPPSVTVTDEDVKEVIKSLQQRLADRQEVPRAAQKGDEVVIDFGGKDSAGKPVNGAEGKDYPLILGSDSFIPGFEPQLIGMASGEEKVFDITFPKDYGVAMLQSKKVTFTVKVTKVQEVSVPKADDAFAAKAGPFDTIKALRADIKKQLQIERQTQADRAYENEIINTIAQKSSVAIPKSLIDEEVERAEQAERQNLAYRGQTWQEHLAEEGVTEEQHRERNREPSENNVKTSLILAEIADRENMAVTPEELEVRLQILRGQYTDKAMQAELDKPENRREIEGRLVTEKTIAKLREYAQAK